MRKLFVSILSLLFLSASANNFTIGSGSGFLTLNAQGAHQRGDTALITSGTYTGADFSNLVGIIILPKTNPASHPVFFTGGVGFRNVDSCEIGYLSFVGFSGNGMDLRAYGSGRPYTGGNGPISHSYIHHMYFQDIAGSCINANGGLLYVPGDTTRYAWYKDIFDSITEIRCNNFCQGSFGSPTDNAGQPPNVMAQITISRLLSIGTTSTSNQGVEIRSIIFEYNFHDWTVFDLSGRGNSGDCGLVYGHGTGTMYNIYKYGGPGYVVRMAPTKEIGRPGISREYNIIKTNSTDYGVIQHQNPDTVTAKFGAVDSINCYNITGGNMGSDNNYWCQVVVLGDMSCTGGPVWMHAHIKNCIGFNVTDHANGDLGHDNGTFTLRIVLNMGTGLSNTDTSNNKYYVSATQGQLDSLTSAYVNFYGSFPGYKPTTLSPGILGTGTTNPYTSVDYYGLPYNKVIGYAALPTFIPPGSCNCIPKYRGQRLYIKGP